MLKPAAVTVILALSLLLPAASTPAQDKPATPIPNTSIAPACTAGQGKVDEQGYVTINGIEQWITVRGERCSNPILLVVHGGPGNPLSPYSDALYGAWSKEFTVVQWDQRGAGMTYGRNKPAPDAPLTLAQLSDDGVQVAAYVTRRFGKKQVVVFGSSWGSILAVRMIKQRPELFSAYLGTAQVVGYRQNQPVSYAKLLDKVRAAGDQASLDILQSVGTPPWTDPRSFGKVRRVIRQYENKVTTPAPKSWWVTAPTYDNPQADADYEAGEDYSFLNFVGLHGDGMFSKTDLPALGSDFAMPVFLVQGTEDLLTTPDVTQRYYDTIRAPQKALIMVPHAGHDPNPDMIAAQYKVLKERILPLAQ